MLACLLYIHYIPMYSIYTKLLIHMFCIIVRKYWNEIGKTNYITGRKKILENSILLYGNITRENLSCCNESYFLILLVVSAFIKKNVVKLNAKGILYSFTTRNQHLCEVNRNDYTKAHPTYTELSTSHFLSCLIVSKL